MSTPPAEPGGYEVVVRAGQRHVVLSHLRAAGHRGRVRLRRLRRWLATPQGRRVAVRAARGLVLVGVIVGGAAMVRRWAMTARSGLAAVAGAYRSAAGAIGAAVRAARLALPFRWGTMLMRWLTTAGGSASHIHCPECHARLRADAHVCYRCGNRALTDVSVPRRWLNGARWIPRVLTLALYRRCPDCRRLVHTEARLCHTCGYRFGD